MATRASNRGVNARGSKKGRGKGGYGPPGASRMPAQLQRSYLTGKASTKIGWGASGDFKRCTAEAAHHGIPARMRPGMCARLHRIATGRFPGRGRNH